MDRVTEVDTTNNRMVSRCDSYIVMMLPPRGPIPFEEALRMAAWIVVIADETGGERFAEILAAIKNT